MKSNIRLTVKRFVINAGSLLVSYTLIPVIWLGENEIIQERMKVDVLTAFISYFGMLFRPIGSIAGVSTRRLKSMGLLKKNLMLLIQNLLLHTTRMLYQVLKKKLSLAMFHLRLLKQIGSKYSKKENERIRSA